MGFLCVWAWPVTNWFIITHRHIKEHLGEYYDDQDVDEQLNLDSDEATQFHYFKLHDYNNDNKLDGLELFSAINHYSQEHSNEGEGERDPIPQDQIEALVDTVLEQDDFNDDGFIDYFEFVKAQKESKEKDDKNEV